MIDGQDWSGDPVATVHLPVRVPLGFHGSWAPAAASEPPPSTTTTSTTTTAPGPSTAPPAQPVAGSPTFTG